MKEKNKMISWIVFITALCAAGAFILDYHDGTGFFTEPDAGFACYTHEQTITEFDEGFEGVCDYDEMCYGYIEGTCDAIFTVMQEGNTTMKYMVSGVRYVCFQEQRCIMTVGAECSGTFAVLGDCTMSYAVVNNTTYWCNGTVESCEYEFKRRF